MLAEITIKDFAIIDQLTLQFAPGFNVLTGETGAGKSIILDAVSLLLGDRADTDVVRTGTETAIVEGIFVLPPGSILNAINETLAREGLEGEAPDIVTLSREVRSGGRSLSRINGRTVTLGVLKEIGDLLIDIHGQSEHLSLLKPSAHVGLLDGFGDLDGQRGALAELAGQVQAIRAEIESLQTDEAIRQRQVEMLTFKAEDIEATQLKPGEDEQLREEVHRLANAEQLATLVGEAYQALFGVEDGSAASDRLSVAALALARLVKIDQAAQDMATLAESLSIQAEELGRGLGDYRETLEFDPARLTEAQLRFDLIQNLKRKYHGETIDELLAAAQEARRELAQIEHSEEHIGQLRAQEEKLLREMGAAGAALSRARAEAADRLSRAIELELGDLKMEQARFGVSIEQVEDPQGAIVGETRYAFDSTGIDRVEFLIAPNVGEPLKPVVRIASGGETSRIMLALKTVLSRADQTPTLIFDEIDQGIGGRIGAIVGQKLWSLSGDHQVLVVTHLPQLAGFGDTHFKVDKQVVSKRTTAIVSRMEGDARVEELSAMIGKEAGSSRQSAQEILDYVQQVKAQAAPSAS